MAAKNELFRVTNRWGGEVVLTKEDWNRIKKKRPDVDGYEEHVRQTLEQPTLVFEGKYQDSKVFYRMGLLDDDPDFTGCYVAVVVRYTSKGTPGTIRTVYFPFHVQGALGNCLYASR